MSTESCRPGRRRFGPRHFLSSKAHLRLGRVHAKPGAAPAERPHEVVPGRGGGADRAEPLRKDGEGAGGDVPVLDAVTMSLIVRTSGGVSRWGDVCGQDD
jgi:hypothetical protein